MHWIVAAHTFALLPAGLSVGAEAIQTGFFWLFCVGEPSPGGPPRPPMCHPGFHEADPTAGRGSSEVCAEHGIQYLLCGGLSLDERDQADGGLTPRADDLDPEGAVFILHLSQWMQQLGGLRDSWGGRVASIATRWSRSS